MAVIYLVEIALKTVYKAAPAAAVFFRPTRAIFTKTHASIV